jgi:shikimate dehydrogenase
VNRPELTAATRLLALLGDPVAHSLSPVIQNAAMKSLQLDGVYVALRCASTDVPSAIRLLAHSGGGGNVTLPHKQTAAAAVDRRTAAVERTGACNTFWLEGGRSLETTQTWRDLRALDLFVGDTKGARVLLLGAGGVARAVVARSPMPALLRSTSSPAGQLRCASLCPWQKTQNSAQSPDWRSAD